jgi:hypothetical protein
MGKRGNKLLWGNGRSGSVEGRELRMRFDAVIVLEMGKLPWWKMERRKESFPLSWQ